MMETDRFGQIQTRFDTNSSSETAQRFRSLQV